MKRAALVVLVLLAMAAPLRHLQPFVENGTAWGAGLGIAWAFACIWATTRALTFPLD